MGMKETISRKAGFSLPVLILAFAGAMISVVISWSVFSDQARTSRESLWPLPGLIMTYWALMGMAGFVIIYFSLRKPGSRWLQAAWFLDGMFIPLFVLGAWTIGTAVLLAFLVFLGATIALETQQKKKWLESLGILLLGAVINLGILYFWIILGR